MRPPGGTVVDGGPLRVWDGRSTSPGRPTGSCARRPDLLLRLRHRAQPPHVRRCRPRGPDAAGGRGRPQRRRPRPEHPADRRRRPVAGDGRRPRPRRRRLDRNGRRRAGVPPLRRDRRAVGGRRRARAASSAARSLRRTGRQELQGFRCRLGTQVAVRRCGCPLGRQAMGAGTAAREDGWPPPAATSAAARVDHSVRTCHSRAAGGRRSVAYLPCFDGAAQRGRTAARCDADERAPTGLGLECTLSFGGEEQGGVFEHQGLQVSSGVRERAGATGQQQAGATVRSSAVRPV